MSGGEMTERAKARNTGTGYPDAVKADTGTGYPDAVKVDAAEPVAEWPRAIRTTMEPHREYLVGESEYLDLQAQGLIKKEEGE